MHTRSHACAHAHTHTCTHSLNASTYFASGKGRKMQRTSPHTYVLAHSRALIRAHTQALTHTHILHTHTHRHVHIHTHPRSRNASFHERTEILTSHLKTKHATYADMYTCTCTHALNTLVLRFRKGQKRVTDKHTYIRAHSHALAPDITLLMSSCLCQHDDITVM